jgi:hypothetical protein
MNKKNLRHILKLLHFVHYFILLGLCIFFSIVAVFALRGNNEHMVKLRAAVFSADKQGSNIEASLSTLRAYVYAHMNTNLSAGQNAVKPPIQLKYEFERRSAIDKADYDQKTAKVLSDAETTCTAQVPGPAISQERLICAKAYAAAHSVTLQTVPEDLYKFDFASPAWSPDLAGWSIVAAVLFLVLFIIRYVSELAIRYELKNHA